MDSVSPRSLHPLGGTVVTIVGSDFGDVLYAAFTGTVAIGGRSCAARHWNTTHIVCSAPVGVAASASLHVTVAGQVSTTATVSFDSPHVSLLSRSVLKTQGGDVVNVTGSAFTVAPPLSVEVGLVRGADMDTFTPCTGLDLINDTAVACVAPEGVGIGWYVVVYNVDVANGLRRASNTSAGTASLSYYPPNVTAVSHPSHSTPAVGGFVVVVNGTDLSRRPMVFIGGQPCTDVTALVPHSSVSCTAPPRVYDQGSLVSVVVDGQSAVGPALLFDPPAVTSVTPAVVSAIAGPGRSELAVSGMNFGVRAVLGREVPQNHSVTVGARPCSVLWLSDALLSCSVPGDFVVGTYAVSVRVYDEVSVASAVSVVAFECPVGYFGLPGETCQACPLGGECTGGLVSPSALAGYFPVSRSEFVRCSPVWACLGGRNASCAQHYTGPRCATCSVGAYRY